MFPCESNCHFIFSNWDIDAGIDLKLMLYLKDKEKNKEIGPQEVFIDTGFTRCLSIPKTIFFIHFVTEEHHAKIAIKHLYGEKWREDKKTREIVESLCTYLFEGKKFENLDDKPKQKFTNINHTQDKGDVPTPNFTTSYLETPMGRCPILNTEFNKPLVEIHAKEPDSCLFSLPPEHRRFLSEGNVNDDIKEQFILQQKPLLNDPKIYRQAPNQWIIVDGIKKYKIEDKEIMLNVYGKQFLNIPIDSFEISTLPDDDTCSIGMEFIRPINLFLPLFNRTAPKGYICSHSHLCLNCPQHKPCILSEIIHERKEGIKIYRHGNCKTKNNQPCYSTHPKWL